jgi:DNA-directed RNA polymerase specialized sigma24 family protein
MTFERDPEPGRFPDISKRSDYARLVALAKRRLVGLEHHAEDVVSLALIKWAKISSDRRGIARIEQVIKTEAYSFIRSERRARERDTRAHTDRSLTTDGQDRPHNEHEAVLLRRSLAETSKREGITITDVDREVFELMLVGFRPSEIVRRTDLTRHQVRRSRQMWQQLLRRTISEPAASRSPAPQT